MSEAYSAKVGGSLKLKLKGEKSSSSSKKKHSKKRKFDEVKQDGAKEDELQHGGAWEVSSHEQISGPVAIEMQDQMYIHGLDNGLFVLGSTHAPGEPPEANEILTAVKVNEKYFALKSGYGKYLSVNSAGLLIGRSDAIGEKEYFEVEFDYDYDGRKTYIKASNKGFLNVNSDGDIVAVLDKKSESMLRIRSIAKIEKNVNKNLPEEERSEDLRNVELNYVKKFQKFQDKRILLSKGDVHELDEAKKSGELHEKLLDRREKMKADRYCK